MCALSPITARSSIVTPLASRADGCTIALGWIPLLRLGAAQRSCAALAKAMRGWGASSTGIPFVFSAAKLSAIRADAPDSSAADRFFSWSTKIKSPGRADRTLAIPVSCTLSSPITRAWTNSATSLTERGLGESVIAPFYTFAGGKESWIIECRNGAKDLLDQLHGARAGGGFHFAALV